MNQAETAVRIENVIRIAKAAGAIAREGLGKDHKIGIKGRQDVVTEIDKQCESYILRELKKSYPTHAVLTEETGVYDGDKDHSWYIDPLDGTMNYAHGVPFYSVSIAYARKGELTIGVVYDPSRDECFYAEKGCGAFLNGRQIMVSETTDRHAALLDTGFSPKLSEAGMQNFDLFAHFMTTTAGVRRMGSAALGMAYVAAGRMDGMWELCLNAWDIAGGLVLLEEAGAVTTWVDGNPDVLRKPYGFWTANPTLHAELLKDFATVPWRLTDGQDA